MANHMAEVAKMLGVELSEEFEVKGFTSEYNITGKFTDVGMEISCRENELLQNDTDWFLCALLCGKVTIKRKPWKPKRGETYWYVEKYGDIWEREWHPCRYMSDHVNRYKIGNCYRTREEAEANRDKWAAFYASDEVLEV